MATETRKFTGRIRQADYDTSSGQLDLRMDNGSVHAYKQVPAEVWRRLCSAPSPAAYWEDRIAEEYPKAVPARQGGGPAKNLSDLFAKDE